MKQLSWFGKAWEYCNTCVTLLYPVGSFQQQPRRGFSCVPRCGFTFSLLSGGGCILEKVRPQPVSETVTVLAKAVVRSGQGGHSSCGEAGVSTPGAGGGRGEPPLQDAVFGGQRTNGFSAIFDTLEMAMFAAQANIRYLPRPICSCSRGMWGIELLQ